MRLILQYLTLYPFLGLLWLISILPRQIQHLIARLFAWLFYYLLPSRRKVIKNNIAIAFPNTPQPEKDKLFKQSYQTMSFSLIEMAIAWFWPIKKLKSITRVQGQQHIEAAKKNNQGVIILLPHYTNMEIIGVLLSIQLPIYVTYHLPINKVFSRFQNKRRKRTIVETISSKNLRAMMKVLKQNKLLWYSPDQSKYEKNAPYIPFFSKKVRTTTGTVRMAQACNAQIIPLHAFFDEHTKKYVLSFQAPLSYANNDIEAATTTVNQAIERLVYKNPSQYLWAHKRFKDYI